MSPLPLEASPRRRRVLAATACVLLAASAGAWPSAAAPGVDRDGDKVADAKERKRGCSTLRRDTDRDRMPDRFEVRYRLKCDDRRDAHDDPDRDGRSNLKEFRRGTNPRRSNVPTLGDGPAQALPPLPETGFALADRFNTATPNRGERFYEGGPTRQDRSFGGTGGIHVVPGRFLRPDGEVGIATVAPGFIRLWHKQQGSCFLDRDGARSFFAPKNQPFTGLRQPCAGGDPTPDTRWATLNRPLFNEPGAVAPITIPGQAGQGLVVTDLEDGRVDMGKITHGDGRRVGEIHLASDMTGPSARVEKIADVPEPRSVAASSDGNRIAALSTECASDQCQNQHYPDDVFAIDRSGSGWGAPKNLQWYDNLKDFNTTAGREAVVCGGQVLVTDVDGVGALDIVRWGGLCPSVWLLEGSGAQGSGVEFMLGGSGKVVALSTKRTLTGVALADLDGIGKPDLVLSSGDTYLVGLWSPSAVTSTSWGAARGRSAATTATTVPGVHYDIKAEDLSGDGTAGAWEQFAGGGGGPGVFVADVSGPDAGDPIDSLPDLVVGSTPVVLANQGALWDRAGVSVKPGSAITQRWQEPANGGPVQTRTTNSSYVPDRAFAGPEPGQISVFSTASLCEGDSRGCFERATLEDEVEIFRHTERYGAFVSPGTPDGSSVRADVGEDVSLVATLSGERILRADWDFDADGAVDRSDPYPDGVREVRATHAFTAAGNPRPKVTLTNEGGNRSTATGAERALVITSRLTPVVEGPSAAQPGDVVRLTASATGGTVGTGGYTFEWTLDGKPWAAPGSGATYSTSALPVGRHIISVRARDSRRLSDPSTALSIRIADPIVPRITTDRERNAVAGTPLRLEAGTTTGGIGPLSYEWDLDGNGSFDTAPSTEPTVETTFSACCAAPVGLRVSDSEQGIDRKSITRTIDVRNALQPVVDVAAVSEGFPKTVRFEAGRSLGGQPRGSAADQPPYVYAWKVDGALVPGETGRSLRRTFAEPGRHDVEVVLTDAYGNVSSMTPRVIDVGDDLRSDLIFKTAPAHPQVGERITLTAPAGTGSVAWDLGDGEATPDTDRTRTVTYQSAGIKTIRLQVTKDGAVSEARQLVDVLPRLVARPSHDPAVPAPGEPVTVDAGVRGGLGPFSFAWDDGSGAFPAAGTPEATRVLRLDRGEHVVSVRVEDSAGHTATGRDTIIAADPLVAGLAISPKDIEAGNEVTFDASASRGGVGTLRYAFDLDGKPGYEVPVSARDTYSTSFDVAIEEPVGVRVTDEAGQQKEFRRRLVVAPRLKAVLADPGAIFDGVAKRLDARATTGGTPPYAFRWDVDGKIGYERETGEEPRLSATFPTPGSIDLGVQVTDARGRVREARRTVEVRSGCQTSVKVGLGEVTAGDGTCMRDVSTDDQSRFVAKGDVRLNGLLIDVPAGGSVEMFPPGESSSSGRGRITASAAKIEVDGVTVIDGPIEWRLPPDDPQVAAEEALVAGIGLPEVGVKLLGLSLDGRIGWTIGVDAAGERFTRFRGSLVVPGFNTGDETQDPDNTGVGARVNIRVDAEGTHTDGIFLRVQAAKLGKLTVNDLCLSYLAAGNTDGARCEQFTDFTGKPFLSCRSDSSTNRWDGTADIALPATRTGLKASGGLADGKLSHLALEADLGRRVALEPGVAWLSSVAAGFCLRPAPLTIKGAARITAVPTEKPGEDEEEAVVVDGTFLYTDSYRPEGSSRTQPWSIEMTGTVDLYGRRAADARFGFDGDATASFGFHARYQLPNDRINLASIDGSIDGWVNFNTGRFNVEGSIEQCLVGVICQGGEALISSDGVAGCVIIIPAVSFGALGSTPAVRAGFGFAWSGSFSLMGPSCDIGRWRAVPGARAVGPYGFDVKQGELVRNLRLHGAGAPPSVVVHGPNGERLEIPAMQRATGAYGEHLMVENSLDGTTVVQLVKPTAGRWTVEPRGVSTIAKVETSGDEPRPVVHARVTPAAGGKRTLEYSYSAEPGVAVAFGELGAGNDVAATIGEAPVAGETECGEGRKCGRFTFSPAYGDAGRRQIVAAVTRDGMPVDSPRVASYAAPAPLRPGKVRRVRISRGANGITAVWARAARAERYEVTATEMVRRGGRWETGFSAVDPDSTRCYDHPATDVPSTSSLRVLITAVDARGERGPTTVRVLPRGVRRIGPRGTPGAEHGSGRGERLSGGARADVLLGLGGDDLLLGGRAGDCLIAGDGDDKVTAGPGDDRVEGDAGDDLVLAGSGDDRVTGAGGSDELRGGFGDDDLTGGRGADRLSGGAGTNRYAAGPGNDRIKAANGSPETVVCGPGRDRAIADRVDTLTGCEQVQRVG